MAHWVERVAWSRDGRHLAVGAARHLAMADASCGEIRVQGKAEGTIYALEFLPEGSADGEDCAAGHPGPMLGVGAYGGVTWIGSEADGTGVNPMRPNLSLGAAAVLAISISPDGDRLAAGCLDKRLRLFCLGDTGFESEGDRPRDWVGFDGPVRDVKWNPDGTWLAASGGGTLLAMPRDVQPGEAPTLCISQHNQSCASEQPALSGFRWCQGPSHAAWTILAAVESATGRTHLFDVSSSSHTFPRRTGPIATLEAPSGCTHLPRSALPQLTFCSGSAQSRDGGWILVSDGEALGGKQVMLGANTESTDEEAGADELVPCTQPTLGESENTQLIDAREASVIQGLVQCGFAASSLSAADLCHVSATCTAARRCADSTPSFWATVDLSQVPRPTAFFDGGHSRARRFSGVIELTLQFCEGLQDAHLSLLPPSLRRITLDACHAITDAGLKAIAAACGKRLEQLSIYWNMRVSDKGVFSLGLRCPSLTALSLSGCKQVGDTGALGLASRCRRLTALNLTRLPLVSDTALAAVVQANTMLVELRLYAASQYGDAPLVSLATHCRELRCLDCTGLSQLTDAALHALGCGCHALEEILLSWVTKVTDDGVLSLARGCPGLTTLSLHGIKGVGLAALDALAEHCAETLVALDVRGCIALEGTRTPEQLIQRLPKLVEFVLHTT